MSTGSIILHFHSDFHYLYIQHNVPVHSSLSCFFDSLCFFQLLWPISFPLVILYPPLPSLFHAPPPRHVSKHLSCFLLALRHACTVKSYHVISVWIVLKSAAYFKHGTQHTTRVCSYLFIPLFFLFLTKYMIRSYLYVFTPTFSKSRLIFPSIIPSLSIPNHFFFSFFFLRSTCPFVNFPFLILHLSSSLYPFF